MAGLHSCQRYPDNPPYFQPYDSASIPKDRRVLVIAVDGLQSDAFKAAATPNYTALLANAKYTWDAKSDIISRSASSWKTLTSGVTYSSHHIADSNFMASNVDYSGDFEGGLNTPKNYPSVFYFIARSKIFNAQTAILSSWGTMVSNVANEARVKGVLNNDVAVKDSALKLIKNSDPKLVMLHFSGPAKLVSDPSSAASFSASSPDYVNALKTVDGYIGDIMTTLKARPNYNTTEDWLVVIAGTHGGVNKSFGGTSDAETNVPTLYYNKSFKKQEFTKQGSYSAVKMDMAAGISASADDADGSFNPGTSKQLTIQFKFKGSASGYPHVFSKWSGTWSSGSGWSIYRNDDNRWGFSFRSTTGSERRVQPTEGPLVFDNKWHTLTVVIYDSASKRWIKRFTDNQRLNDPAGTGSRGREITGYGDISSAAPLTIGVPKDGNTGSSFNIADVKIFNTALDDATIVNSLCLEDYTKHSKIGNMIGYWPCNDGVGNLMANKINSGKNFTLAGAYKWTILTDYPCNFTPTPPVGKTTLFLKNIDISAQIFYWLQLSVPATWDLEGNIWLTPFENEFIKI
ncbi:DUF4983 domain-containing protein [Niabella pedocola]|uniref:DUF4983 domain-containing protein n=1 Tax=Niabella pedocola TaxID=1752077 RepID=A0ABS8PUB1_9BACT|nr:alkaline phosphatase family protein [Niabella pedocola]MCD2424665.1 DUF4983 domain-containing protein [Niabella pedocola]